MKHIPLKPILKSAALQWTALLLIAVTLGTIWMALWQRGGQVEDRREMRLAVEVKRIEYGKLEQFIQSPGTVIHFQKAAISSKVAGRIAAIYFRRGDRVAKGQLLARLESDQLELGLKEAQSALRSAQAELALARSVEAAANRNVEQRIHGLERLQAEVIVNRSHYLNSRRQLQIAKELYSIGGISPRALRSDYSDYLNALSDYFQARKSYQIEAVGFRDRDLRKAKRAALENRRSKLHSFIRLNTQVEQNRVQVALALARRAEVEVRAARILLSEARITTPIAGVIAARSIEVGEEVRLEEPIFTVLQTDQLLISIDAAEEDLRLLQIGQEARCSLDAYSGAYNNANAYNDPSPTAPAAPAALTALTAKVEKISPTLARDTRTVGVDLLIDNRAGKIYPGMFARCQIKVKEIAKALAVPAKALQEGTLFLFRNGIALRRKVTTGERYGELVEVQAGLEVGDRVIVSNISRLREGLPVIPKSLPKERR